MNELPKVYLALGSNLGDRERNIAAALRRLEPLVRVEAVSALYETDPVPEGQPPYLNAACRIATGLHPKALLRHVKEVERELGRRPGERWGPRPIDIDVLLYGDLVIDERELRLPHAGLPDRPFVLVPLADNAADMQHPQLGRSIGELASETDRSGVRLRAQPGWEKRWPPPPA
jgi:2-amino-4-hydroxy-6-hydroxymethyldihydropteridine diphosphokinase